MDINVSDLQFGRQRKTVGLFVANKTMMSVNWYVRFRRKEDLFIALEHVPLILHASHLAWEMQCYVCGSWPSLT